MKINKFNFSFVKAVYIIALLIILIYSICWFVFGNKYKNYIKEKISNVPEFNITYKSINLSGFPFKFGLKIKDLNISKEQYGNKISSDIKNFYLSKALLSEKITANLDNIIFRNNDKVFEVNIKGKNDINFELTDEKDIKNIDVAISKIIVNNRKENTETVVTNLIYKTDAIKNDSYINKPNFLDIEKVESYLIHNGKKELISETNLYINFSLVDVLSEGTVLSSGIEIEKILINNLTQDYSILLKGDYKTNSDKLSTMSFDLDFKNYENFLSSMGAGEKSQVLIIKKVFDLIPDIKKEDVKNKHIEIRKNNAYDTITVNGKDVNDIISGVTNTLK